MARRLLVLNGLAAICAVCHHAVIWALTAMFFWTDRYQLTTVPDYRELGSAGFYTLRMIDQVSSAAVPAFLFVSGYFITIITGRSAKFGRWSTVAKRVRTLLPAYLLWSLAIIGVSIAGGTVYSASAILGALLTGRAAPAMYYVPLLIQLYLLSPLLILPARRYSKPLLALTALLQLTVAILRSWVWVAKGLNGDYWYLRPLLNSNAASFSLWFVLGMIMGCHVEGFNALIRRAKPVLPWLLGVAYVVAFAEWEVLRRIAGRAWLSGGVSVSDNVLALCLLLTFLAFAGSASRVARALSQVGVMSYGIYLVHIPVLEILARSIYHVAPRLLSYEIAFEAVLTVGGVGVPVALMMLTQSTPLRRYYVYIFG